MSETITKNIRVRVESKYIPEQSNPTKPLYFFAYFVTIRNEGDKPVTLISRYWHITDATGHMEEVRGPGVVGYQPRLELGQAFQYSSFCPLKTHFGVMKGTYQMAFDSGEVFDAVIAPFQLVVPQMVN